LAGSIYFIIKLVINNAAITSGGFIFFKAINLIITNGGFAAMLGYTRGLYINITTARPVLSVAARSNFVSCVPCWISSLRFVRQPLRFVRQPNCRLVKADSPNIQTRVDLLTYRDND
jgi:hypothetical protein